MAQSHAPSGVVIVGLDAETAEGTPSNSGLWQRANETMMCPIKTFAQSLRVIAPANVISCD